MSRKPSSGVPLLISSTLVGLAVMAAVFILLNWINELAGGPLQ